MQQLHFSYNWNKKLNGTAFTSLKLSNRFSIGDKVEILLKDEVIGEAEVIGKKTLKLADINDYIAYLDTGYNKSRCKEILTTMYKNKKIDWDTQIIRFYLFKMYRRNGVNINDNGLK